MYIIKCVPLKCILYIFLLVCVCVTLKKHFMLITLNVTFKSMKY